MYDEFEKATGMMAMPMEKLPGSEKEHDEWFDRHIARSEGKQKIFFMNIKENNHRQYLRNFPRRISGTI